MLKQLSHIVFKRYIALEYFNCPMSLHGLVVVATCGTLGHSLRTVDLTQNYHSGLKTNILEKNQDHSVLLDITMLTLYKELIFFKNIALHENACLFFFFVCVWQFYNFT